MRKTGLAGSVLLVLFLSYGLRADIDLVPDALTVPTTVEKKAEVKKVKPVEVKKATVERKADKPKPKPKKYALTINANPADARIRNTTIKPKYRAGMKLPAGSYTIVVSKAGYTTVRKEVRISNKEVVVTIDLPLKPKPKPVEKLAVVPVVTTPRPPQLKPAAVSPATTKPMPAMQFIKGGTFQMGCISGKDCLSNERVHSVTVNDFYMAKTEVTVSQYMACVKARVCRNPEWLEKEKDYYKKMGKALSGGHYPIVGVSWQDAVNYATWLGKHYRLPTEAEWEVAARAGSQTVYPWGNALGKNKANCAQSVCGDRYQYTAPVGSFAAYNGLYDMNGNVWEWTCSAYEKKYEGSELVCANENDSRSRVLRGGSWLYSRGFVRSAHRYENTVTSRNFNIGFRVVRTR